MRVPLLFGAFILAFTTSWALTTPPGSYPDELHHYVRALAVAHGDWYGDPNPNLAALPADEPPKECCRAHNAVADRWVEVGVRVVSVPAELAPDRLACEVTRRGRLEGCTPPLGPPPAGDAAYPTTMGRLQPAPYLLPGLAALSADDATSGLRRARLADALLLSLLLTATVAVLWRLDPDATALLGPILALTPMVLFVASSPSPSAFEVAAGWSFPAVLLAFTRPSPIPAAQRSAWGLLTITGAVLALSRTLGPLWMAIDLAAVAVLRGRRPTRSMLREHRAPALVAGAAIGVATIVTLWWQTTYQPSVGFDSGFFVDQAVPSVIDLRHTVQQLVGVFGALDVRMHASAYWAWLTMAGVLAAWAFRIGTWRERAVFAVVVLGTVGTSAVVSAGLLRQVGFDLQGRHVMGVAVLIPLFAGELVTAHRSTLVPAVRRWAFPACALIAGVVQVEGVLSARRAYGWSTDPGRWGPPGGTALWLAVLAAGAAALVAGAVLASMQRED